MILADRLAYISNEVFDNYSSYSGFSILFGFVAYTFCLYADFSGFIDIVSGVSRLFGIKIAENFRRPFFLTPFRNFGADGISPSANGLKTMFSILFRFQSFRKSSPQEQIKILKTSISQLR